MSAVLNKIFAALQIELNEVRLLVSEFYNGEFYIIDKECASCQGFDGTHLIKQESVVEAINQVIDNASKVLKTELKTIILCVPGNGFTVEKRKARVQVEEKIKQEDIKKLASMFYNIPVDEGRCVVNLSFYKSEGNKTKLRFPLGQSADYLQGEFDVIIGSKEPINEILSCIAKTKINVDCIYQECYCAAKEAALFVKDNNLFTLNIYLESTRTVYMLIYNGRIYSAYYELGGYLNLVNLLRNKYGLSYRAAHKLLFKYGIVGTEPGSDRIINKLGDQETDKITYKDLQECIGQASDDLAKNIYEQCKGINKRENLRVVVTGQGAALNNLGSTLSQYFSRTVTCYCPSAIGAREHKWASLLGALSACYEDQDYAGEANSYVDIEDYISHLKLEK